MYAHVYLQVNVYVCVHVYVYVHVHVHVHVYLCARQQVMEKRPTVVRGNASGAVVCSCACVCIHCVELLHFCDSVSVLVLAYSAFQCMQLAYNACNFHAISHVGISLCGHMCI